MKIIAKTIKGITYIHSTKTLEIYIAPDSSAEKMVKIMNDCKYRLKNDTEMWHVYDETYPTSEYVEYKLYIRNGLLKAKRIAR